MATAYQILGQVTANATLTVLYTAGGSNSAVISTVVICNTSTASKTFRVAVTPAYNTGIATQYYLAYDTLVPANDTIVMTLGITLAANNSIRVYGSTADVAFSAFGAVIT